MNFGFTVSSSSSFTTIPIHFYIIFNPADLFIMQWDYISIPCWYHLVSFVIRQRCQYFNILWTVHRDVRWAI